MKNNQSGKGGARPGAGRKQGVPNKATIELKELARQYTEDAVHALVNVMMGDNPSARVTAAKELLDRGYGKPSQFIEGKIDVKVAEVIHKVIDGNARD